MICRKAILRFPMPLVPLLEHINADFVLETPKNGGSGGQKRTKTSILCSGSPKMGGQRQKAHKNLDFVLGKPENLTSGLMLVLLLMLIIDKLDVAIFCIDWIYNNNYFILHCQR